MTDRQDRGIVNVVVHRRFFACACGPRAMCPGRNGPTTHMRPIAQCARQAAWAQIAHQQAGGLLARVAFLQRPSCISWSLVVQGGLLAFNVLAQLGAQRRSLLEGLGGGAHLALRRLRRREAEPRLHKCRL